MRLPLLFVFTLLAAPLAAQPVVGTCEPATADAYLEGNLVRARIFNDGALFWRGDPHSYEVPRGGGVHSIFASSLWLGGKAPDGTLRMAATTYGPFEFWPGPLDDTGRPPQDCADYDRLWRVNRAMVREYEERGVVADDLRDWPTGLGAPTEKPHGSGGFERIDVSGLTHSERISRVIDLEGGERPAFYGDEMVWWIMNDLGNEHRETGIAYCSSRDPECVPQSNGIFPIGVEVQGTAYAFARLGPLATTTYYRYRIENRSGSAIDSFYVGLYMDADLGTFDDDYVGSDTTLDMGFVYNASTTDGWYGIPPALGVVYAQGANAEGATTDTVWVEGQPLASRRALPMSTLISYFKSRDVEGGPSLGMDYYRNMQGRWKTGAPITEGGTGYNPGRADAKRVSFSFPGDPVTESFWSEVNGDGSGSDDAWGERRFMVSSGPVTLAPGEVQEVVIAIVWARGADRFDSIVRLREAVREVAPYGRNGKAPQVATSIDESPALVSPADGAALPFGTVRLAWTQPPNGLPQQVQLARDADFTEIVQSSEHVGALTLDSLAAGTYFWRVRGTAGTIVGPWSDVQSFTLGSDALVFERPYFANFLTVANADGPIEPPEYAAFAFNQNGFPHPTTTDRPDGTKQQSSAAGLSVSQGWGFHTFGDRRTFGEFFERVTRGGATLNAIGFRDYEMRFTGTSLAWARFGGPDTVAVPFELWDIGPTPDDPSDDVRLIPGICERACGADSADGVFDIGGDSPLSGGTNDPYTDALYWYLPVDQSPGEAGYRAYEADARRPTPTRDPIGHELFARTVLMGWNMGTAPGPYTQALPEQGTIFRIVMAKEVPRFDAPVVAGPADGAVQRDVARLFWSEATTTLVREVQLARDAAFTDLARVVYPTTAGRVDVDSLRSGAYYWRVRALVSKASDVGSAWSRVGTFTLDQTAVQAEREGPLPETVAVAALWPHPFASMATLRYGVPVAGSVRIVLYDVLGREVQRVLEGDVPAGWHEVPLDASALASGLYVVRVVAGEHSVTRSLVVAR